MDEAERPIIVKKIKKGGHGHHGGAWKVAFADFATAMMAFFLLLWLLATASPEQQKAIAGFFDAEAQIGVGEGGGFSDSMIDLGGTGDTSKGSEGEDWESGGSGDSSENDSDGSGQSSQEMEQEAKHMEELLEVLKQAIDNKEELKAYKDQLKLSVTPEGLRIQIVDKENRPMFESGKAVMREHATKILNEIAPIITKAGNRISLTGHTDGARFIGRAGYSNWELSADRANAARRALINAGMPENKVGRVVGLADSSLYNPDDPRDPINRRISIVVMNKATDEAIGKEEGALKVDSENAQNLDLENPPPIPDPLQGISESVIDSANDLKGDNIIVDTQQAPATPTLAPLQDIGGQIISLPLSQQEINSAAEEAVPVSAPKQPENASESNGNSAIKIDLGGLTSSTPEAEVIIDSAAQSEAVVEAEPAPEPTPTPAPPSQPLTPGAVPLSLPGL